MTALPLPDAADVRWQVVEDRVFILSASTVCPSPDTCDMADGETYEAYVRRHLANHNIPANDPTTGAPWDFAGARRNLAVWCLYYFHKWIQGNMSLLPYPCWQDADFLANGTFTDADLEVGVPWDKRSFTLKPYADRVVDLAQYKRMRKMTKVRETQKSSWSKAFITWRHLRAYFIERNIYFRVMVISATSALGRDNYLEVFAVMWAQHAELVELFGTTAKTQRGDDREMALLDWKKAKLKDGLQVRWNVNSKNNTGQSVTSLFVAGMDTATTGRRWDLIVVDDPCIPENSQTEQRRQKVKKKGAELRKQLSAVGELVWLNTPHHLDDASAQIDEKFPDEFHILYRPARWGASGNYQYYWQRDGICAVKTNNIECGQPRHEHRSCHSLGAIADHPFMGRIVWDEARVAKEERQLDFYSQVLLLVRDERHALFHEKDFEIIPTRSAPEEIRFGLGRPLSEEEVATLTHMKLQIRAVNQIDTAGKEKQTTRGDRNVTLGVRFSDVGEVFVTHLAYGFWSATEECEAMWAACVRNQPNEGFEYEVSGAHEKYVRKSIADFEARKSHDMKRPVSMGVTFINASEGTQENKRKRIEKCQPYTSTGRVKILADAGSDEDIKLFIREFCDFPWSDHDDGPDAFSRILKRMEAFEFREAPAAADEVPTTMHYDGATGVFSVDAAVIEGLIAELELPALTAWGDGGIDPEAAARWVDRDSVPGRAA